MQLEHERLIKRVDPRRVGRGFNRCLNTLCDHKRKHHGNHIRFILYTRWHGLHYHVPFCFEYVRSYRYRLWIRALPSNLRITIHEAICTKRLASNRCRSSTYHLTYQNCTDQAFQCAEWKEKFLRGYRRWILHLSFGGNTCKESWLWISRSKKFFRFLNCILFIAKVKLFQGNSSLEKW